MMTPREVVRRTVKFQNPDRLAVTLPEPYGRDITGVGMDPSPDRRPPNGPDEWGAVWLNIGVCKMGEVQKHPLTDWAAFDQLTIPDITDPARWEASKGARERAGDQFLMASGISLYERVHFIRGLEDTWMDIYQHPDELGRLIDVLVEMNLAAIERYAGEDADGFMWCDDWGLQNRLMIRPEKWVEIWKPRYARVYRAAHAAGMLTFLHSCGHIVEILDDLIDAGLDVIQMDQQMNMGLDTLGERFGGRIAFWCPVDIQAVMPHGSPDDVRAYCRRMVDALATPEGGFICGYYGDPKGAGHPQANIDAMADEFLKISAER